jgi:alpha-mannosidase
MIAGQSSPRPGRQVIMATPAEFFGYIEDKYRAKVPGISGDITSAWTDDPGIYAQATALKRRAASRILAGEKFAVLDELLGGNRPYPDTHIANVYKDLLIYTDHTYGMSNWRWEHGPLEQSRGELHAPVFDYYKQSWEDKKEYAYRAAAVSDELLRERLESLASKISTSGKTIAVFNSLSWPRTDVVRILHRGLRVGRTPYSLVDTATGERVPYQSPGGDERYDIIAFVAKNVPALGYKTYGVVTEAGKPAAESVTVKGHTLEN